ncbi:MAG: SPOR domain-containing protein, partial [Rhodobacteraceae bacterium]|nr:SPOR domain-containing protein [Paracoccaceae bacterium]
AEAGLWDGRPSLGGVWVSYPDVPEPERVLIRNASNGQTVIGALFRREREVPGPRIQVSSDAAVELGMLAGQPVEIEVVALRREEIVVEPAPLQEISEETATTVAAAEVTEETLDDPIAAAAAAIEESEAAGGDNAPLVAPGIAATATAAAATGGSTAATATSSLEKPFVQIGIFSVEANANNTAASLKTVGVTPTVLKQSSQGKTFWRVIVGPSQTSPERADVLAKVKGLGFSDAYFVTN